jgi:trehalose 6-phosphate synthase
MDSRVSTFSASRLELTKFSDKILWPLLHYQINEICISQPDWEAYQDVNRLFAEAIEEEISDNSIVWIQDYHLFLLPQMLRRELKERGKKNVKMGFFLHTVFPASDFFRILPVRRDIIASVLNCDVIGLHNIDYAAHFLDCCHKIM